MLILCIGPDTFRAQRKANELEKAFREKYDVAGSSVERLPLGKAAADEIVERAHTMSLFTPRRFLRTANLLNELPAAKIKNVTRALSGDQESTIVVSIEEEMPKAKILEELKEIKIIKYDFTEERGARFSALVEEWANELMIKDQALIKRVAEVAEGDSWLAWGELSKIAAGGTSELALPSYKRTMFDFADAFLRQESNRYNVLEDQEDSHAFLATFLSGARSFLRARDRATEGLHPYVVKKMMSLRAVQVERALGKALLGHQAVRSGLGSDGEAILII
jgi:hypothetical protein